MHEIKTSSILDDGLVFQQVELSGPYGSGTKEILQDSDGNRYGEISGDGRKLSIYHPLDGMGIFSNIDDIESVSRSACDVIRVTFRDGRQYHAGARILDSNPCDILLNQVFENDGTISTAIQVLPLAIHLDKFCSYNVITERVMIDRRIFSETYGLADRVPLSEVLLTELQALAERKTPDRMDNHKKLKISRDNFLHVVEYFARKNPYNPFLDRFRWIKWDGISRMDSLLSDCGGQEEEDYLKWISKAIVLGTLERQFHPSMIQCVPILIGPSGIGKSTLVNRLGLGCYHKATSVSARDVRPFHESVSECVIAELDECSQFRGRDSNHFKSLINMSSFFYRKPYAKVSEDHPVRFMMIGTTNHPDVLEDLTSSRRFYPVRMSKSNSVFTDIYDDLTEDYILQVWAEGLHRYNSGERWSDGLDDVQEVADMIRTESTREGFGVDEINTILQDSSDMKECGKVSTETVRDSLRIRYNFNARDADRAIREFNMVCNNGSSSYEYCNVRLSGRVRKGYRILQEAKP